MLLYTVAGIIYAVTTFTETIAILVVLYSLYRLRLWRALPFYYLATGNLINDLLMTLIHGLYITPCILAETYFFKDGLMSPWVGLISFGYVITWYVGASLDLIIALDRLFMIKQWKFGFKTRKVAFIAATTPFVVAPIVNIYSAFISPCCRFLLKWEFFGYYFHNPNNEFNWTDSTVDLPLNISTSIVSLACYGWITLHVFREKKRIAGEVGSSIGRKRDYTLAINYGVISMIFIGSWVTLRVFAIVFKFQHLWMTAVTPYLMIIKCSANAIMFLKNNREIRKDIKKIFGAVSFSTGTSNIVASQTIRNSSEHAISSN